MHSLESHVNAFNEPLSQESMQKIEKYNSLLEEITKRSTERQFETEGLDISRKCLEFNPEQYTVWNFRKRILKNENNKLLYMKELEFSLLCLKRYPKCYSIWNHRLFIIQKTNDIDLIEKELKFVDTALCRDGRNFHVWSYRTLVMKLKPHKNDIKQLESELLFSKRLLLIEFSNFSAWHHRTFVFPEYIKCQKTEERIVTITNEFKFINKAIYTDPMDESIWLYFSWLIKTARTQLIPDAELAAIFNEQAMILSELVSLEPQCDNAKITAKALAEWNTKI